MTSAQDMALRGLRIKRTKGNLVYTHNGAVVTKEQWDKIVSEPVTDEQASP